MPGQCGGWRVLGLCSTPGSSDEACDCRADQGASVCGAGRSAMEAHPCRLCTQLHLALYSSTMDTISGEVTTRELRGQLSDVLGRAMYGGERIGVTRNGKLAAVVVGVADLEALEALEMAQDVAAYRAAKAEDAGERVSLAQVRDELAG